MSNPVLNEKFVEGERILEGEPMTINGSIQKSLIMLAVIFGFAAYSWNLASTGFMDKANMLGIVGAIAGLVAVLVMSFTRLNKTLSPILAIVYSIGEGLFLGFLSAMFEASYPGIVVKAIAGSFAAMLSMLLLYRARVIRCTETFRSAIITATLSVLVIYVIQIVASFFGRGIPEIFTASPIGIAFSVVICGIAAFNFILDFDYIERASEAMLPKQYEWFGAVGIMTSLVWLYVELLKLLAKLNNRN